MRTNTIKYIKNSENQHKITGYGVLFNVKDLDGDTFTKDTDYGLTRDLIGMPCFYGHKGTQIGLVTNYSIDDVGIWYEIELDKSNRYLSKLEQLTNEQRIGMSSGALSHLVEKDADGTIKRWLMNEISLLTNPAESRTIQYTGLKHYIEREKVMSDVKEVKDVEVEVNTEVDALKEENNFLKELLTKNVGTQVKSFSGNEEYKFSDFLKAVAKDDVDTITAIHSVATKDLGSLTGSNGGYLVPTQFIPTILQVSSSQAVVRPRAMVIPTSGSVEIPGIDYSGYTDGYDSALGGLGMVWTQENSTDTQTQPKFRQISFSAYEATTSVPVSNRLLENNAIGLETVLTQLFGKAITYAEDNAYIKGNGVGKPLGFMNGDATLTQAISGSVPTIAELASMYSKLLPESENTAVWLVHPLLYGSLLSINATSTNTNPITWLPNLQGKPQPMLFGMPVIRTPHMSGNWSNGGLALVDFSKYIISENMSMEIAYSQHAEFRKRQTLWRCTITVDGKPMMNEALQIGSSASEKISYAIKTTV